MIVAFLGIFVYGLLAALPGSVLPSLERNQFLPGDSAVATFLLINAVGAVLAYAVSGPIIDRIGTKVALKTSVIHGVKQLRTGGDHSRGTSRCYTGTIPNRGRCTGLTKHAVEFSGRDVPEHDRGIATAGRKRESIRREGQ